jgi:hypothetical protein
MNEAIHHLGNDNSSFHPVLPLIRAVGPPDLHLAKGRGHFRGLLLSNHSHRSSINEEARLFKKAPCVGAFLSFMGHCVMETRSCLVLASAVTQATGKAERDAAVQMSRSLKGSHHKTLGAHKGYDTREFVADLRIRRITPHVAQNLSRIGG